MKTGPMTEAEIRRWIGVNLPKKAAEFGVRWMNVDYNFHRCNGAYATTSCEPEYEKAYITFDVAAMVADKHDVDELIDTVEHELSHIVHAPFWAYHELAKKLAHDDHAASLDHAFLQAAEQTRCHIGRLVGSMRRSAATKRARPR